MEDSTSLDLWCVQFCQSGRAAPILCAPVTRGSDCCVSMMNAAVIIRPTVQFEASLAEDFSFVVLEWPHELTSLVPLPLPIFFLFQLSEWNECGESKLWAELGDCFADVLVRELCPSSSSIDRFGWSLVLLQSCSVFNALMHEPASDVFLIWNFICTIVCELITVG